MGTKEPHGPAGAGLPGAPGKQDARLPSGQLEPEVLSEG